MKIPHGGFYSVQTPIATCVLRGVDINVKVVDLIAEVKIAQTFTNDSLEHTQDCSYVFPLYSQAAVVGFKAKINEREVVGKVKEKEQAVRDYKEAVRVGDGAYLLVQDAEDIFQLRVGNLPAQSTVQVVIKLVTDLKFSVALGAELVLPMVIAPRYGAPGVVFCNALKRSSVVAHATPPYPLRIQVQWNAPPGSSNFACISPSHGAAIVVGPESIMMGAEGGLDKDFVLNATYLDGRVSPHFRAVLEYADDGSDTCVAMVTIVAPAADPSPIPKTETGDEFVFLLDRSGSMQGAKLRQMQKALPLFVRSLPVNCHLNIVGFGDTCQFLWSEAQEYSERVVQQVDRYVDALQADMGGTELLQAFEAIFGRPTLSKSGMRKIFVLTDGEIQDVERVLYAIRSNHIGHRIFALGIGNSVSHALVNGIARAGQGTAEFVLATEADNVSGKVILQLKNATSSSFDNIMLQWTLADSATGPAPRQTTPPPLGGGRPAEFGILYAGEVHMNVSCDACHVMPIRGNRFKCRECANFDLCAQCLAKVVAGSETHEHRFQLFDIVHAPASTSPQDAQPRHKQCISCQVMPIPGRRFRCRTCAPMEVNMCTDCFVLHMANDRPHRHPFNEFDAVDSDPPETAFSWVMQTPTHVPSAFAGCKNVTYVFFPKGKWPTALHIQGTGRRLTDRLDINITFEQHPEGQIPAQAKGLLLHRCAARRLIRELEDGCNEPGFVKPHSVFTTQGMAKQHMIDVSTRYGVLCSLTAFVALEKRSEEERQKALAGTRIDSSARLFPRGDSDWTLVSAPSTCMGAFAPADAEGMVASSVGFGGTSRSRGGRPHVFGGGGGGGKTMAAMAATAMFGGGGAGFGGGGGGFGGGGMLFGGGGGGSSSVQLSAMSTERERERDRDNDRSRHSNSPASLPPPMPRMSPTTEARFTRQFATSEMGPLEDEDEEAEKKKRKRALFEFLVKTQEFDGRFVVGPLDLSIRFAVDERVFNKTDPFCDDAAWSTALVIFIFERFLLEFFDEWEMMIGKARATFAANQAQILSDAETIVRTLRSSF